MLSPSSQVQSVHAGFKRRQWDCIEDHAAYIGFHIRSCSCPAIALQGRFNETSLLVLVDMRPVEKPNLQRHANNGNSVGIALHTVHETHGGHVCIHDPSDPCHAHHAVALKSVAVASSHR